MRYVLSFSNGAADLRCKREFVFEDGVAALTEVLDSRWFPEMKSLVILDGGSAVSPTRG